MLEPMSSRMSSSGNQVFTPKKIQSSLLGFFPHGIRFLPMRLDEFS